MLGELTGPCGYGYGTLVPLVPLSHCLPPNEETPLSARWKLTFSVTLSHVSGGWVAMTLCVDCVLGCWGERRLSHPFVKRPSGCAVPHARMLELKVMRPAEVPMS